MITSLGKIIQRIRSGVNAGGRKNVNLIRRRGENHLWHLHENLIKHTQLSEAEAGIAANSSAKGFVTGHNNKFAGLIAFNAIQIYIHNLNKAICLALSGLWPIVNDDCRSIVNCLALRNLCWWLSPVARRFIDWSLNLAQHCPSSSNQSGLPSFKQWRKCNQVLCVMQKEIFSALTGLASPDLLKLPSWSRRPNSTGRVALRSWKGVSIGWKLQNVKSTCCRALHPPAVGEIWDSIPCEAVSHFYTIVIRTYFLECVWAWWFAWAGFYYLIWMAKFRTIYAWGRCDHCATLEPRFLVRMANHQC